MHVSALLRTSVAGIVALLLLATQIFAGVYRLDWHPLTAWKANPYRWVADDDIQLGVLENLLLVRMAQNEYEHTAFALTNNTDSVQTVSIQVECAGIPGTAFQVRRVVMFEGAREGVHELSIRGNVAWSKPELLREVNKPLEIPAKKTMHLWITVHSRELKSGRYAGWVRLVKQDDGSEAYRIPIQIEIWPFRLPDKTGLHNSLYTYIPGPPSLAEEVAKLIARNHFDTVHFEVPALKDGKLEVTANNWLERLKIARRCEFFPVFEVVGLGKDTRQANLESMVKELGFKHWYFLVSDEAAPEHYPAILEQCKYLREVAPSAGLYHAFWAGVVRGDRWEFDILESLRDNCDVWLMMRSYMNTDIFHGLRWKQWPGEMYDFLGREQKSGDWILFYHNTCWGADYPDAALAWIRPDGWYAYQYGYDGYVNVALDSPPHVDAARFDGQVKSLQLPPEKQPIFAFFYPLCRDEGRYEVLSCKRLEACGDAFRDYMYLLILGDLTDQAESSGTSGLKTLAAEARATIEDAIEEIRLYPADYYAYCNGKRRIALEIIKLMQAGLQPRLNGDGTIRRHRGLTPEKVYPPQEGGVPHPWSG